MIGDHHSGLVKAIRKVMIGAGYQRCRVHFLRNVFAVISKQAVEMVAATIRTIFTQPTADAVHTHPHAVADMLGTQFPKVKAMPLEAEEDLTAFANFPDRHRKKIWSTNPLERVNREIQAPLPARRQHGHALPQQRPCAPQHHQHAHPVDPLHHDKGHDLAPDIASAAMLTSRSRGLSHESRRCGEDPPRSSRHDARAAGCGPYRAHRRAIRSASSAIPWTSRISGPITEPWHWPISEPKDGTTLPVVATQTSPIRSGMQQWTKSRIRGCLPIAERSAVNTAQGADAMSGGAERARAVGPGA